MPVFPDSGALGIRRVRLAAALESADRLALANKVLRRRLHLVLRLLTGMLRFQSAVTLDEVLRLRGGTTRFHSVCGVAYSRACRNGWSKWGTY